MLVLAGVLFYTRVEKWTVLNAFYFCIVTLATVGYGDITPTTDAGKIFTMLYIVVGLAIIGGFFATLGKLIRPGRLLERGERDLEKGERDLTRDLPLGGGGQPTKNSPDQSTEEEKPQ